MRVLYTTREGGSWKPIDINPPDGEIFAICFPDGAIWDRVVGSDNITSMKTEVFERLANNG